MMPCYMMVFTTHQLYRKWPVQTWCAFVLFLAVGGFWMTRIRSHMEQFFKNPALNLVQKYLLWFGVTAPCMFGGGLVGFGVRTLIEHLLS